MSCAPAVIPFYREGAGRLFTIYCDVTQTCNNRPMHDPHVTHSTQVVGKRNWRRYYRSKDSATHARTPFWAWPNNALRLCVAQARGLLSVYKSRGSPFTPLLVHGQSEPHLLPHLAGQWEEAEAQEY